MPDATTVAVEAFAPRGSESRKLLAAFIQSAGGASSPELKVVAALSSALHAELEELKAAVGTDLPEYMVPSFFVPVASLPTNTSGKIDRKKLREAASAFDQSQLALYSLAKSASVDSSDMSSQKPILGSQAEETLARLWAEVLNIDIAQNPISPTTASSSWAATPSRPCSWPAAPRLRAMSLPVLAIMRAPRLADMALAARPMATVKPTARPVTAKPVPDKPTTTTKSVAAPAPVAARPSRSSPLPTPVTVAAPVAVAAHVASPARVAAPAPVATPTPIAAPTPVVAPAPVAAPAPEPVFAEAQEEQQPYSAFQLLSDKMPLQRVMEMLEKKYDIEQDQIEDIYPCTPLQEGLMALTATHSAAYVLRDIYTLPAGTDVGRFKAAWAAVVRRNSILRTRVVFVDGLGSYQVVLDKRLKWQSGLGSESVDAYLARDRATTMSYGTPLARWALLEDKSTNTTKFVWSIHHALYDGFSVDLTLEAVDHAYRHNNTSQPELRPFVEFIRFLEETDRDAEKKYWTQQLEGTEAVPFPPPSAPGHQSRIDTTRTYSMTLQKNSGKKGRKTAGLTTASVLKAAWSIVLSRISDSSDVIFGVTQFGRDVDLADADLINGPTIATVPVRVRVDAETPVSAFLAACRTRHFP